MSHSKPSGLQPDSHASVGPAPVKPPSERMRETLRRCRDSQRTEAACLMWFRQIVALHGGVTPMRLGDGIPRRS
jgi:hypothetical protein